MKPLIGFNAMALMFMLASCDQVVSQTPHHDRAFVRASTQTCAAGPGYCCEFGFGFDGKYEYSCGMKLSCTGRQPVTQRVVPVTLKYESGKVANSERVSTISVDGPCND